MKWTLEMPEVVSCNMKHCTYNHDTTCHARAITVGGVSDHMCDTMYDDIATHQHAKRKEPAGVGACKATDCKYNADFECQTESVRIGESEGLVNCETFATR